MKIIWVLGDQLYQKNYWIEKFQNEGSDFVVLFIESKDFTSRYRYHAKKIFLIFASMRAYAIEIKDKYNLFDEQIIYKKISNKITRIQDIFDEIARKNLNQQIELYMLRPSNNESNLLSLIRNKGIKIHFSENPNFLTSKKNKSDFLEKSKTKLFFNNFYITQRRNFKILLDETNKPIGGKWSYDSENRKKLPISQKVKEVFYKFNYPKEIHNLIKEVRKDLSTEFNKKELIGDFNFIWYPITRLEANRWFEKFLVERLENFGKYEDSISSKTDLLYHSGISLLLNIGLLDINEVVQKTIEYYNENSETISLSSIEGFIRQILGWREYVKLVYDSFGEKMKSENFFNLQNSLSSKFYTAETGLLPVDDAINKVIRLGYLHHIERLMIMGNIMLLLEIRPVDVFRWFMELFIDSYEWVMVPNVFGMSQFSDGGSMVTKPYISGSSYIFKMSNYSKKEEKSNIVFSNYYWWEVWDSLYWEFINKNRDFFSSNPRLSLMVKIYDKKSDILKREYSLIKKEYLSFLNK